VAGFDLGVCHGGIMRIRRALVVPVILALGVAGSILATSAVPLAAAHSSSAHVTAMRAGPDIIVWM
jgi:hypothetical protein